MTSHCMWSRVSNTSIVVTSMLICEQMSFVNCTLRDERVIKQGCVVVRCERSLAKCCAYIPSKYLILRFYVAYWLIVVLLAQFERGLCGRRCEEGNDYSRSGLSERGDWATSKIVTCCASLRFVMRVRPIFVRLDDCDASVAFLWFWLFFWCWIICDCCFLFRWPFFSPFLL